MKTQSSIGAWAIRHGRLALLLVAITTAPALVRADPDEDEVEGPFRPLFKKDPTRTVVPIVPADQYHQVGTALSASPEYGNGYRWDLWAVQANGAIIGRMALNSRYPSRRLIDLHTGETIGVLDCTNAPLSVSLINRYGRRVNIDLCMDVEREVNLVPPYPLYRVHSRGHLGEPLDVDHDPIGTIDEFQMMLLDEKGDPVARFEPVRLTEIGARRHQHDLFFEAQSLTSELFTSKPSNDLLRRIETVVAEIVPTNALPNKLLRVDLATRWIQVGAAMITDKSASVLLQPERIAEVRDALTATSITELNFLWKRPSRQLIWGSLIAANPLYELYAQGARLAELDEDPEVLDHALRLLKAVWIRTGRQQLKVGRQGPFEEWMRAGLADAMRFQTVRNVEQALDFAADYKVVLPSTLVRARPIGDPPVVAAYSAGILRAANQASAFDRAVHLAAALQRGGRDVTIWSLSIEKIVDDQVKTRVQEPLIVFLKEEGKPEVLVIGSDAVLAPFNGKKLANGYYEFPALKVLQPLLARSAQFQVPMAGVLNAQGALSAWIEHVQQALTEIRLDDPIVASILLEFADSAPWQRYNQNARESLATLAQSRFANFIRDNKIQLRIERVKDGKVDSNVQVTDVDSRPADERLPRHEATIGRSLHLLPPKFEERFRAVTLRSEPILEDLPAVTIEDGRIKVDTRPRKVFGRATGDYLILSAPSFPEAFHELMHRWGNSRFEVFEIRDWKGTVVDLFNEISWQRKERESGWDRRSEVFKLEDFYWDYGATNEREDFAVIGQFYGTLPKYVRGEVRDQLKKGNFIPAAKYLYFKMIAFLDVDGRSVEMDVDDADKPFTMAEFERTVRAMEKKGGLSEEQERLRNIILRIKILNGVLKMRKATGSIAPLIERETLTSHCSPLKHSAC